MNYSYCTIEEAWGDNLNKENRKKKKKDRRKYHSKYEGYVEDTSYSGGLHNDHCSIERDHNLSNKNKLRHSHGKKARKIKNRKNDNYEISYMNSNNEYKKYRKESKDISKNNMKTVDKIENEQYLTPSMYNPYSEEEQVSPYEEYNSDNNFKENKKQNNYISNNKYESNDSGNEYENYSNYNMELIEGFESNGEDLDNHTISRQGNEKVNDVDTNNKSKRAGNLVDKLLEEKNMSPSTGEEMSSEEMSSEENNTDSELSSDEEEPLKKNNTNNQNLNNNIKVSKKDIDYKLTSLNRNLNTIIRQMNKSQFFDDDSQDNIHDLILFVLFGIFIIFILDSIYKLGKNSSPSIGY